MTLQHRSISHRMIKARQGLLGRPGGHGDDGDDETTSSQAEGPTAVPSFTPPDGPAPTTRSSTPVPAPSTTSDTPRPRPISQTTSSSSAATTTTDEVVQTTTSPTSTSSTETTTSSSSSSSTITSTSTAPLSTITSTRGVTVTSQLPTSALRPVTRTSALSSLPDATSSAPSSSGSGVKVGSVIGGVVGVLAGLAVLAFIVAFFLRRWRKRRHRDTIFGDDDLRRSQFVGDNDGGPLEPPVMAQRHQSFTPSLINGPGMAGHGAYGATAAVGTVGMGVAGAAAGYGAMGSNYGYAQDYQTAGRGGVDDDLSEHAHGIYSSEPQVQRAYNPEAYGSYAAYQTPAIRGQGDGYQEATRQYAPSFEPQYNQYVVTEPAPAVHAGPTPVVNASTAATNASMTQRDPASLNGNRNVNARSVVADEDVYGGI